MENQPNQQIETPNQEQSPVPVTPVKKPFPIKILAIGAGVFVIILMALVGIIVAISLLRAPVQVQPEIKITPTPVLEIVEIFPTANPKYASDSALLEIRENLKVLNQQIGSANFFEPEISPPSIDLNIEIK